MAALNLPDACDPIYKRAESILTQYGDALQDAQRTDDLVFLNMLLRRRLVFGTDRYEKRLEAIEAGLPISDIAKAQLDPDVAGCVKSNRT
jgi:hypothetical protein